MLSHIPTNTILIEIAICAAMIPALIAVFYILIKSLPYYRGSVIKYLIYALFAPAIATLFYAVTTLIIDLFYSGAEFSINNVSELTSIYGEATTACTLYVVAYFIWKFRPLRTTHKALRATYEAIIKETSPLTTPCIPHLIIINRFVKDPKVRSTISYTAGRATGYVLASKLKGLPQSLWTLTTNVSKSIGLKLTLRVTNESRIISFDLPSHIFSLGDVEAITYYLKGIYEASLNELFNQNVNVRFNIELASNKRYNVILKF
ncbi:MAG: hypothetical protein DRO18_06600 [Thermoprotei archaeon]|nr:MAG: hypothetical protein B6U85_07415 [Desulfurococcales archaeon ex4484_42]RLG84899.1 MAG: hypothetical protein DRO18_06600 [Thermoprotei archaeon]